jgi:BirA family biotin operon repressor/biotin-[acetyl-CoA-carboxylase] ligase
MRSITFDVLQRLSDRHFCSGQALALDLGISRTAVWAALNDAREYGIHVQRVHGRGYRLAEPIDWLDAEHLGAASAQHGLAVEVLRTCESTNTRLLELADSGAASGQVTVAEMQTKGRGRLGRAWHCGFAKALTFSLLWRFDRGMAQLAGLSLAVGVALARVLTRQKIAVELKWPNDIYWKDRKLGGVLIEARGEALGPVAAVIGIGINVRLDDEQRARIDQPAADLMQAGAGALPRGQWLVQMLAELAVVMRSFAARGFSELREEWLRYSAHRGKALCLDLPAGAIVQGIDRGIDDQGRLLVDVNGRVETFLSADVRMRFA